MAIRGVKTEEIFKAAEDMGLNPVSKPVSAYSKRPWSKIGVVLVDKSGSKTKTIKDLSRNIKVKRARKKP